MPLKEPSPSAGTWSHAGPKTWAAASASSLGESVIEDSSVGVDELVSPALEGVELSSLPHAASEKLATMARVARPVLTTPPRVLVFRLQPFGRMYP
jgi:hypothetical protein